MKILKTYLDKIVRQAKKAQAVMLICYKELFDWMNTVAGDTFNTYHILCHYIFLKIQNLPKFQK